jgi:hypothetical protein
MNSYFKKLSYILGIVLLLSSVASIGFSQENEKREEHHTGVKRTYNKAKHKVKQAWKRTKSTTAKEYNKAKTRVTTDDDKRDQQERK